MVKRQTRYIIKASDTNGDPFAFIQCSVRTKNRSLKILSCLPFNYNVELIKTVKFDKRNKIIERQFITADKSSTVEPLLECSSIRKLWHHWNYLIGSIIPDGFQVLTTGTNETIPTALSIRNRIKALMPTPYNCYLLDRDIRRYLKLGLRHD